LQNLLKDVLNKFPDGSYAPEIKATLEKGKLPDDRQLMHFLMAISRGLDSEGKYKDDESRVAALQFIKRLITLQSE
jgi:hypothetical protein